MDKPADYPSMLASLREDYTTAMRTARALDRAITALEVIIASSGTQSEVLIARPERRPRGCPAGIGNAGTILPRIEAYLRSEGEPKTTKQISAAISTPETPMHHLAIYKALTQHIRTAKRLRFQRLPGRQWSLTPAARELSAHGGESL